ncbi:BAG4 regulator, partial [Nothocercus julius]|nr:BAG4 regulator [Nothocercus julius]
PSPSPQALDSPYANGAAGSAYPPYPPYEASYRPPSPAAPWSYSPTDAPAEGSSLGRQRGAGYSPPQTPGMPVPQYPYGEAAAGATPQGSVPQPRPQEEPWAPCVVYGMQPRYSAHGNPFVSEFHPSWSGGGIPPCPLSRDSKDSAYEKPEQSGANPQSYYPDVNHQHLGTMSDQKPPPLSARASPSMPKVQYSAQPQMYGAWKPLEGHEEAGGRAGDPSSTNSTAIPPEIQRILHVTEEAEQLEQEVDEFVGKKTEKSYRLLEEMLTKLLLELDSIETGGQDSVRQARKEAVHRIQAILEKLERKGL